MLDHLLESIDFDFVRSKQSSLYIPKQDWYQESQLRQPDDVVQPTNGRLALYRWEFSCPGTDAQECKNTFYESMPLGQATASNAHSATIGDLSNSEDGTGKMRFELMGKTDACDGVQSMRQFRGREP